MYSESKQALADQLELKRPAVLAVSGVHGSGKTTLLEKLLPILRGRGLKVGVIKHDGGDFAPDAPGTDGRRLREAGAQGVAVYSGQRYLLTEEFRLTEQVRSAVSAAPESIQPLAVVGDIPGANFGLEDTQALVDWLVAQMPTL